MLDLTDVEHNIILNTDSYKASHFLQYPPMSRGLFSYIEGRGNGQRKLTFFGLQMFIKEYLSKPITQMHIDIAELIFHKHGVPFNRAGWEYILNTHKGYIPVRIKAVPEGIAVPTGNVLVTVESTDGNAFWVVNYIEKALLRGVWYPTTVCTVSRIIKETIRRFLRETSEVCEEVLPFKLHDFGSRGVSSWESAAIGGVSHLVNFQGTDTVEALLHAMKYYKCDMAGFSIPAAEHSTITAWGKANEEKAYRNMVVKFKECGIVAVVSDSYNIYNACENLWGGTLKQEVIDSGATVVIRPDSGDPVTVVTKCLEILGAKFGYTTNIKGYKVLPKCIRIIQGDGVNHDSIYDILSTMKRNGWSAENVGFGMGGALLQHPNRDTYSFAMKCSSIYLEGFWQDVSKDPTTDARKKSKAGRISLYQKPDGDFVSALIEEGEERVKKDKWVEVLLPVFENGKVLKEYTLDEIRKNSEI